MNLLTSLGGRGKAALNALIDNAAYAGAIAFGLLCTAFAGGGLAQSSGTYTVTDWTDGVQFPVSVGQVSTVLFAAGGLVLVAVMAPGGGFRLVTKAFYGVLKMIRV